MNASRNRSILFAVAASSAIVPATANAQNLFVNPAFTEGNSGFSTTYTYFTGSPLPEGRYAIAHSPREHHPQQADFGDHTTGNGLMMVVNGGTLSNVYDWPVWYETVNVEANSTYDFSAWTTSADALDGSQARLEVRVNGQALGTEFGVPTVGGTWNKFARTWASGSSTTALVQIYSLNTAASGNDFVLDDLSMSKAVPEPTTLLGFGAMMSAWRLGRRCRRRTNCSVRR